ncbi:MAG: 3-isopropylmalate dehydratase large subunit [Thaumarchaeota archaeon]|nr:3-isopropylmalate dehydratase large subunit [Nitrososphaerota archaeon]
MGKTISEKIISDHAGSSVAAGETTIVRVDWAFTHDASGPLVLKQLKELGIEHVADPSKTIIFIDHAVPSPQKDLTNNQSLLRKFASQEGCHFCEAGTGICHQVMAERFASPGQIIVGTDSHTVMAGALGAFATGMGATDIAVSMALRKTWLRVPETYKIIVDGSLAEGVYSKDIILHLIGLLGADGATYKSLEFHGKAIEEMPMNERFVLSNMVVEGGAKAGLIPSDEITRSYLSSRGRDETFVPVTSDSDATFERVIEIDSSDLQPMIALPHAVDTVKPIDDIGEVKVDAVFIGSCTNARLEDLQIAAAILGGKKVAQGTRLLVTPASAEVYAKAFKNGTINTLIEAGAMITPSGCGMCFGALGGVPADGEVVLGTTNRNFQGRMGNPKAFTYLSSPAVAAATALTGRITHPKEVK